MSVKSFVFRLLPGAVLVLVLIACSSSGLKQEDKLAILPSPSPTLAPGVKPNYKVEVSKVDGVQIVNVLFSGQLPSADTVDKLLWREFEKVIKKNPEQDALGSAFIGGSNLTKNQFSGRLVYETSTKKIMTMDEYEGVKTSTIDSKAYLVAIEEHQTAKGITPKRTWLSISLVFPQIPLQDVAYNSMIVEVEKLLGRGLDIDAYVTVGDKNVKTSWYQVKDSDGAFIFVGYEAGTKQVKRKGKLLKQF